MSNSAALDEDILRLAASAKRAASLLATLSSEQRSRAVVAIADAIDRAQEAILVANKEDLSNVESLAGDEKISPASLSRLKLTPDKLRAMTDGLRQVAALPDPLGTISYAVELDSDLRLFRMACPIGLIAVIFESRPDALPQIASLCIKSGNAFILKGGKEAIKTNRALFTILESAAVEAGVPAEAMALLDSRRSVETLLQADRFVDLIIPRGSNQLVRHIQENTRIPVLGHADGVCHIYVDESADLSQALRIVVDSKVQYPAACNALETLLVHAKVAPEFLPLVVRALRDESVELRCDGESLDVLGATFPIEVGDDGITLADLDDWSTEYCDLILSIKIVGSLDEAVVHINEYGSHHTDCIVTEDPAKFDLFFAMVDSAGVYCNASTRFADGFRYGFGAEVGISTGKLHPRGPVGLDGLVTYKYKLQGNGHVVADYSGDKGKRFTHRSLKGELE